MHLERKDFEIADALSDDCEFKFADVGDDVGAVSGYGSVFQKMDLGGDIIHPGAFKDTLADWRKKGASLPMLWQHQPHNPIGVWDSAAEDEKGLKVSGKMVMAVPQATYAHALLKAKAIRGLSIGYRTRDADVDRKTGARHIKKADLYEISLVTMPMQPEAAVTAVKGDQLLTDRELEQAYRDGGLSQREAKIAVAITKKTLLRDAGEPDPAHCDGVTAAILELRKATELMRV